MEEHLFDGIKKENIRRRLKINSLDDEQETKVFLCRNDWTKRGIFM